MQTEAEGYVEGVEGVGLGDVFLQLQWRHFRAFVHTSEQEFVFCNGNSLFSDPIPSVAEYILVIIQT